MNAILTGSHAYGKPGPDSDVDLVVLMDPVGAADLARILGAEVSRSEPGRYPGVHFRTGRLNVIVETRGEWFDVWVQGTRDLVMRRPVTREEACATFERLRSAQAAKAQPARAG